VSRLVRALAVGLPALALALTPLVPAHAGDRSDGRDTIALVTGSQPEGISAGPGDTFFAGARNGGAVYVGDVETGRLRTLVPTRSGEVAVGLLYDASTRRLWVAGGSTGDVTAYDARTGRVLFTAYTGSGRFLNDVAVTKGAVYVTDSRTAEIVVVPLGRRSALPAPGTFRTLAVTGDYVQPQGNGLNGIRVLQTGDLVVVSGGRLYAVDRRTGKADLIVQRGRALTAGDGLVLHGRTLYVVNGYGGNEVVVLRFARDFGSTQARGRLTDSRLDRPTTGALIDGDLYVVNGRFQTLEKNPDAPVHVVRLRAD
jgi:hypothetical protein